MAGRGRHLKSFLYVFVDTLIGGGLVITGQPHAGVYGNAGAIGSMPLGVADSARPGPAPQILASASLATLEERFAAIGLESLPASDARLLAAPWLPVTRRWIEEAAAAIAFSINTSTCLLDLDAVIVAGAIGRDAKVIGAAYLPLHANFAPGHASFLKSGRGWMRPGSAASSLLVHPAPAWSGWAAAKSPRVIS